MENEGKESKEDLRVFQGMGSGLEMFVSSGSRGKEAR